MKRLKRNILKSGFLITAGTLTSRLLGFVREILAAAYFGGGHLYDAFVVAFTIPSLFRRVLGEEMFERAFMPPFERLRSQQRLTAARRFLSRILLVLAGILAILTAGLWAAMNPVVHFIAPGLDPENAALAISLGRMILPFMSLIAAATFCGAILLFSDRPAWYSLAPAAMNVTIIGILVFTHFTMGIRALVLAYLVGAAVFLLVQLPPLLSILRPLRAGQTPPENETETDPGTRPGREGARIFLTALANKSVELVDKLVASLVGAGAISSLWYSFRIIHLPFAILGLAISRAIAPELSRLKGNRNYRNFGKVIHLGIDVNLYLMVPLSVFFIVFSREIVVLFYYRGAFSLAAVSATTLALRYYALALLPMGLIALLNRMFSAFEDNRAPMQASIATAVLNITLDFILYRTPLKQGGIALATAISMAVQVLILLWALRRYPVRLRPGRVLGTLSSLLLAMIPFLLVLTMGRMWMPVSLHFSRLFPAMSVVAAAAFGVYGLVVMGILRSRTTDRWKIALTGGGTGGHVYPALAIYQALLDRNRVAEVRYFGVAGRAEEEIVPRHHIPLIPIPSAPVAGGSLLKQFQAMLTICRGTAIAAWHLVRYKPHLVVASGGYVSAPIVFAAFLLKPFLKIRIVLNEQNLVPGLLNKVASMLADTVLVSFPESAYFMWSNRCVYTGYPVRKSYLGRPCGRKEARRRLQLPENNFIVLAVGGSMGARSLNRCISDAAPRLSEIPHLFLVHSVGLADTANYHAWRDTMSRLAERLGNRFSSEQGTAVRSDGSVWYEAHPYLHNLDLYQQAADLVICRAGAGSIAEGLALGLPMILVPKRGLPGDHQELNAIAVAEEGGAEVLFEQWDPDSRTDILDSEELQTRILQFLENPEQAASLGERAAELHRTDPLDTICRTIDTLMAGEDVETVSQIVEPRFVRFQRSFDSLVAFLDHHVKRQPDNLYVRLYNGKLLEYLAHRSRLTVNKGIKLIGSLQRTDLYPFLYENFSTFCGYQKRNALAALVKADVFAPEFAGMIKEGLADGYFETRREAIRLFNRFHDQVTDRADIHRAILTLLERRMESFEVRAEAIRAAVRILDQASFQHQVHPFLFARNIRYREALLDAIQDGLAMDRFPDRESLRRFLKQMLITTSRFKPTFIVRQRFVQTLRKLERSDDD